MPTTAKATVPGTLVTARITDADGTVHTFHGTAMETVLLHTGSWETPAGVRYNYLPANGQPVNPGYEPATNWLRVYSATGNLFPVAHGGGGWGVPGTSLDPMTGDWLFGLHDFHVRLDSDVVDVQVATKEARDWVEANLSIDNRRSRIIEQVSALDPKLGQAVDRLLGDVEEDAFDRGKDHEWHSNND